jgi:hypothetical protein
MAAAEHRAIMERRCQYRTCRVRKNILAEPPTLQEDGMEIYIQVLPDGRDRAELRQTPSGSMADERGRSGRRQQHRVHHIKLVRNARNRPELGGLLSITNFKLVPSGQMSALTMSRFSNMPVGYSYLS